VVLLIEDEPQMRRFLRAALENGNYQLVEAGTAREGLAHASSHNPDIILLDLGLPDGDGIDVTRQLREWSSRPIIVLSARGREADKVAALDAGADDYLTKPFEAPELIVRIEALLRRAQTGARKKISSWEFQGIFVDFAKAQMTKNGHSVVLSERECRLLKHLIESRGEVVTRDELLQEVWGYASAPMTRTVDVHISWLRQKLEDDPANPRFIVTVHGQGYRFSG
jgi:two-component system KDP operon response regulator KdpE